MLLLMSPCSNPSPIDARPATILSISRAISVAGILALDNLLKRSICSSVRCAFETFSGPFSGESIGSCLGPVDAPFEMGTDDCPFDTWSGTFIAEWLSSHMGCAEETAFEGVINRLGEIGVRVTDGGFFATVSFLGDGFEVDEVFAETAGIPNPAGLKGCKDARSWAGIGVENKSAVLGVVAADWILWACNR